jgi:pyruvate-ferredoxin/flavodoxin oxidoreductase
MRRQCVDGNEAAAAVANALSELVTLYPITPSSPMGPVADASVVCRCEELELDVVRVTEHQD